MITLNDFKIWRSMLKLTSPGDRMLLSFAFLKDLERKAKKKETNYKERINEHIRIRRKLVDLKISFWKAKVQEERKKIIDQHDDLLAEFDKVEEKYFN